MDLNKKQKKDKEDINISFSNSSNTASNFNLSLYSNFLQIAQDKYQKMYKEID